RLGAAEADETDLLRGLRHATATVGRGKTTNYTGIACVTWPKPLSHRERGWGEGSAMPPHPLRPHPLPAGFAPSMAPSPFGAGFAVPQALQHLHHPFPEEAEFTENPSATVSAPHAL